MKHSQNNSIRDAFVTLSRENGTARTILVDTKRSIGGARIRTLKNLTYDTFVGDHVPVGQPKRYFLYAQSKSRVRDLGWRGGRDYEHAMTRLKFAWSGITVQERQRAFMEAVDAVVPV